MMSASNRLLGSPPGKMSIVPSVWFFASALALFPFISTVTGASIKFAELELWKWLWMLWLMFLAIHIIFGKRFFAQFGSPVEVFLWVMIAFMLIAAPKSDLVIDPWKNWFYSVLALVFVRFMVLADAREIIGFVKTALAIWWGYSLLLVAYVLSQPVYPGSIQHQFYLSGMLGLVTSLLVLSAEPPGQGVLTGIRRVLFVTAVVNLAINLWVTEARSVFPFTVALLLITALWLRRSSAVTAGPVRYVGLPLAILLAIVPIFHLSGAMGNLLNEWTYPIFGKLRSVESKTGREQAFQIWQDFVTQNARPLGPAAAQMPMIEQESDSQIPVAEMAMPRQEMDQASSLESAAADSHDLDRSATHPILGLSSEEFEEAQRKGREVQDLYARRQQNLGMALHIPNMAITSSHNLWLDATARAGVVYALAILGAFCFVVWRISMTMPKRLPAGLVFAYWSMASAWGIASQFDDAHWLYHTPYLTLFFLPVLASAIRERRTLDRAKLSIGA